MQYVHNAYLILNFFIMFVNTAQEFYLPESSDAVMCYFVGAE